jgi:hypothetical protein
MTPEEALAEASASLVDGCATADDVAARLKAARCTGRPGDPLRCPLAHWYTAALRDRRMLRLRQSVSVDGTTWGLPYMYLHICQRSGREEGGRRPVPLPPLLVSFASQFDSGGFPELSAGRTRRGLTRHRPPGAGPGASHTAAGMASRSP